MRVAGLWDVEAMVNIQRLDYHETQMVIVVSVLTRWRAE